MAKLPVFKERNAHVYATFLCLFPGLNGSKNCKMFPGLPSVSSAFFGTNHTCLLTSGFSLRIFSQSVINAGFYF